LNPVDNIEAKSGVIKNNREDDLRNDISEFNIDFDDLQSRCEINPQFTSDAKNKMLSVQALAEDYEMLLLGRERVKKGESDVYRQTSKAIAGSSFIRLTGGILKSFAQESNLIGNKTIESFVDQFIDAYNKVTNAMMRDRSISERNHRLIIKLFKDRMWNIGDIITNNKGNMQAMFAQREEFRDDIYRQRREGIGGK